MQHRKSGKKLGRTISHRRAMFRNLVRALVISEKIVTTQSKAKAIKPIIEKLITIARTNNLTQHRRIAIWIPDKKLSKKLMETIAPRYAARSGGYVRMVKLGFRAGDTAPMVRLELIGFESSIEVKSSESKKSISESKEKKSGKSAKE